MSRCGAHSSPLAWRRGGTRGARPHRVAEALDAARVEAVLPPEVEHAHRSRSRGYPGAPSGRRAGRRTGSAARTSPSAVLPAGRSSDTGRSEQGPEQASVPDHGSNGGRNATESGGSGGAWSSSSSSRRTKRLPRTPSTETGSSSPCSTSSSRSAVRPGLSGAGSGFATPMPPSGRRADAQQTVRAVPRQELLPDLFPQRELARDDDGGSSARSGRRAPVAVPPSETEHPGRAYALSTARTTFVVRRPVDRRPAPTLEVERGACPSARIRSSTCSRRCVLREDAPLSSRRGFPEPGGGACQDEGKPLVLRPQRARARSVQRVAAARVRNRSRPARRAPDRDYAPNRRRVEPDRPG